MTEGEWLECTNPGAMLRAADKARTERRLRLLMVHCARLLWNRLTLAELRQAVDVAEQYIEGRVTADGLKQANSRVYDISIHPRSTPERVEWMRNLRENGDFQLVALGTTFSLQGLSQLERTHAWQSAVRHASGYIPSLFRELFGPLPFRPATFDPNWRTETALTLAQGIYEDRAFDRLPILADALQDSGCDNDDLLTHLRDTTAPHVRGCWALDLVLGKE